MLSLPQGIQYKKYAILCFTFIVIISIVSTSHRHRSSIRNVTITTTTIAPPQQRSRYLQWKETNTTTTTTAEENNNDDDVSADTVLITLSIFNTIFFVLPTTVRYAFQKRKCLQDPTNVNYNGCICSFSQLQYAISNSINNSDETSVFIVCPATTIAVEQPLNITAKRFLLTCGTSRFINTQPCRFIRRTDSNPENFINFMIGAPTNVTLEDITFYNGYGYTNSSTGDDDNSNHLTGNGGAIVMTGGYLTLQNVIFEANFATNKGGAIYINTNAPHSSSSTSSNSQQLPPTNATIKIRSRTIFRENGAGAVNGGQDIYIVPPIVTKSPISFFNLTAATTNPIIVINVECIPSTKLNRPKFCNYNNDATSYLRSIVIENVTTDTERMKYTNCFNTDLIETRC